MPQACRRDPGAAGVADILSGKGPSAAGQPNQDEVVGSNPTPVTIPQWYVVQTNAGQERMARDAIKKLKFELWFPTYARMVSHSRRIEQVERPLFPLYIFVRFNVGSDDYGAIQRATGVFTILGSRRWDEATQRPKPPVPIRGTIVDDLRAAAEANGGNVPLECPPPARFEKDDVVQILDGSFMDWEGLVHKDHHRRVHVLLDIFGRETPIVVPRESLALIRKGR